MGLVTYDKIRKIVKDTADDYTTGCLPDYIYFKENHKAIAIDFKSKQ